MLSATESPLARYRLLTKNPLAFEVKLLAADPVKKELPSELGLLLEFAPPKKELVDELLLLELAPLLKKELPEEFELFELIFEFAPPKKELVELELVPAELELLPLLKNELPPALKLGLPAALGPEKNEPLDELELPELKLLLLLKNSPVGSTNLTGSFPQ